jgi:AcrR family transcriptional regulator
LAERGYAGLTVERVAERAGVHKTTVYRRWADREALVTDAVLESSAAEFDLHNTGSFDADLHVGARRLVFWLSGEVGSALVRMLQSDAARLPAVIAARQRFYLSRAQQVQVRIDDAVQAGQLPERTDAMKLITTLVSPIYFRLLVTGDQVGDSDADLAASVTLGAARAGLLTR